MKRVVAVPAASTDAVKETHASVIHEKNDRRDASAGFPPFGAGLGGFSLLIKVSSVNYEQ